MPFFSYQGRRIHYEEAGQGETCVFLHGNTASSRMFQWILPLYTADFRVILLDFLGNGQSERVPEFPGELWIDQGRQAAELCRVLNCGKVHLVGTSGGAYAAVNAALEAPERVRSVVADSFDGSVLPPGFAERLLQERQSAKGDTASRDFYAWCQGEDWETVVDQDTEALTRCARDGLRLFRAPIESIQVPLLITVSRADAMLANDMAAECRRLRARNPGIEYELFDDGAHPLILSRAEELAGRIRAFLHEH